MHCKHAYSLIRHGKAPKKKVDISYMKTDENHNNERFNY